MALEHNFVCSNLIKHDARFQRVDDSCFIFSRCCHTIYVRCMKPAKAARKSRIMCNEMIVRYELETRLNINYMLSNNFMLFSCCCELVVSFSGTHTRLPPRVSGKYDWIKNHNFEFYSRSRWTTTGAYPVSYWKRRYGCMSLLILVIEQQNLLSLTALTSMRLHLWTAGTRQLWELSAFIRANDRPIVTIVFSAGQQWTSAKYAPARIWAMPGSAAEHMHFA